MAADTTSSAPSSRRLLWVVLGGLGALLIIVLVVVLIVWRGGAQTPSGADNAAPVRPVPSTSATPVPLASTAPVVPTGPRPATCDDIYSPAMLATFGETSTLNPDWVEDSGAEWSLGTNDAELQSMLRSVEHLTCVWGDEAGGSGSGLATNVAYVTAEQAEAVQTRLNDLGQNCYDELGGIRCVMQEVGTEGTTGESHFLRDGIWLATLYSNAGPDGYTRDIVTTLWDGA